MKCEKFKNEIKVQMTREGIKIRTLAKMMGCTPATISKWREGNVPPTPEKQRKLAKALGTTVEMLFQGIYGNSQIVFSNSKTTEKNHLRLVIERHINLILEEAQKCPGGLEHMYIEMLKCFPQKSYNNIAKQSESGLLHNAHDGSGAKRKKTP